ncbi:type II secretion system protein [Rosistilla oblonga]|uniref:type II secretion system protein n=1 Tax=Rosistilla oblonga TaxID=2527990 RepID=UPI003A98228C
MLVRSQITTERQRRGFTIVELLVAMALIGVMASMVGMALSSAQGDARRARAKLQVAKIREILLHRWDDYMVMQMPVNLLDSGVPFRGRQRASERARIRLALLRDRMRIEMPDRITDLANPAQSWPTQAFDTGTASWKTVTADTLSAPLLDIYRERVVQTYVALGKLPASATYADVFPGGVDSLPPSSSDNDLWTREHQSAECLYLILSAMNFAGRPALDAFRPSEIADTDGDSMPEIVDPWGTPIAWARWPAGYWFEISAIDARTDLGPDGFDLLNASVRYKDTAVATKPFNLQPLVVSAGPDGEFETRFINGLDPDSQIEINYVGASFRVTLSGFTEIDPYYAYTDTTTAANLKTKSGQGGVGYMGDLDGDGYDASVDNLTSSEL